jgi:hypothetical protein
MRTQEFLYWLLGAVELGGFVEQNDKTKSIILRHIKMVEAYGHNKPSDDYNLVMMIKGIVTLGSIKEDNLHDLVKAIQSQLITTKEHMHSTMIAYYIQGAYELCDINKIKICSWVTSKFPKEKLCYAIDSIFLMTNNQGDFSLLELERFKKILSDYFIAEIDPCYGEYKDVLNAIHNGKETNPKNQIVDQEPEHMYADSFDAIDYDGAHGGELLRC